MGAAAENITTSPKQIKILPLGILPLPLSGQLYPPPPQLPFPLSPLDTATAPWLTWGWEEVHSCSCPGPVGICMGIWSYLGAVAVVDKFSIPACVFSPGGEQAHGKETHPLLPLSTAKPASLCSHSLKPWLKQDRKGLGSGSSSVWVSSFAPKGISRWQRAGEPESKERMGGKGKCS